MASSMAAQVAPVSQMELFLSARNLKNMDIMSKSDPMCRVLLFKDNLWKEIGRTETIQDSLSADWHTSIRLDYHFECTQRLKFEVFDIDTPDTISLDDDDFIGRAETTLSDICCSRGEVMTKELLGNDKVINGKLTIRAEQVASVQDNVAFHIFARKLDKKDFFGLSDPFLLIYRMNEDNTFTLVHKTEEIMKTLDPNWKPFTIPLSKLNNGDYDRPLKFEVFDWNRSGNHELIGSMVSSLRSILDRLASSSGLMMQPSISYEIFDEEKRKKKGPATKPSGILFFGNVTIQHEYSLLDYVAGGCEISLSICVDFTASNGAPSDRSSKHFMAPGFPNEYEKAIRAVGDVLAPYDSDGMIPCFGFGGIMPGTGQVSHCFALNGNAENPYCAGIDGVLAAYQQALRNVRLYGPTLFRPCIETLSHMAASSSAPGAQKYSIILLLTDGIVNDREQTVEAIIKASRLPLSIVIIGVGNEDFTDMEFLDGDSALLTQNGQTAEADIVQFVPFAKYKNQPYWMLAQDVLQEIPSQFTGYFKRRGIHPNPRPLASSSSFLSAGTYPSSVAAGPAPSLISSSANSSAAASPSAPPMPAGLMDHIATPPPAYEQPLHPIL